MPGTVGNLFHEPVWVVFNDVLLGLCNEGDITVSWNSEWIDQMSHQTGGHIIESYEKGGSPTVQVDLAEISNLDNWIVAFPVAQKQVDTDTTPNNRVTGGSLTTNAPYIGTKATAVASQLVLRPQAQYADTTTEKTRDMVFQKAWCRNVDDIPFSIDTPSTLSLTFGVLFDPTATQGDYEWIRGLETEVSGAWTAA